MNKFLWSGTKIDLVFRDKTNNKWIHIETETELPFKFEFIPSQTISHSKYTHWAWLKRQDQLYMTFDEKDFADI